MVRRLATENPSLHKKFIGIVLRKVEFKDQESKPLLSELLNVLPIIIVKDIPSGKQFMEMLPKEHCYTILPLNDFRTKQLPDMSLAQNRVSSFLVFQKKKSRSEFFDFFFL